MNNVELQQHLEVSLSMQRSLASDLNQAQEEMEQARIAIGSLGWMTLGEAITLTMSEKDKQIADLQHKIEALTGENVSFKTGAGLFFSYGSEHGFDFHKSAKEAIEAAEGAIDDYRGDACDGWSEEVDSICWGIIMQSSTKVGERHRTDDDSCDPSIDTICDYALLPDIETPATDAALTEIRAQARAEGIYFTANRLLAAWDVGFIDSPDKEVIDVARMILSAAEMLPDAVEGDFSREFADEMMIELANKLRKESGQ